jgi:hypothetical protein
MSMNKLSLWLGAGLLAAALPAAAQVDSQRMQTCRAVTDAAARLACYDAIPVPAAATPGAAGVAGTPAASRPATASTPATPAAATLPTTPPAVAAFGLPAAKAPDAALNAFDSRIPGAFTGWEPRTRFRLANGQLWEVADGSSAYYRLNNPSVTVSRGTLGSFFMRIEGVSQVPRVRRVE